MPNITSVYVWEGEVNRDEEVLMVLKSRQDLVEEITAVVRANHPYSVPEVIATPICSGHS